MAGDEHDTDGRTRVTHAASEFVKRPGVAVGILASVAVIVAAGLGGYWLGQQGDEAVDTPTAAANPWTLALPDTVDEYSRNPGSDESQTTSSAPPKTTISATYSKGGQTSVLVLLSRPDANAETFLREAAFNVVLAQDHGFCGTSTDNDLEGCAVVRDNTSILAVGMVDQSREELMSVAELFADTVAD